MTEDILFDNIYIGHSVEDAKALAKATFDIKRPLEVADEEAKSKKLDEDDEAAARPSFREAPVEYIRQKVFTFIDLAKLDPVLAFKTHPETGVGLAGVFFTLFGMLGALFGLLGGSQKPITKVRTSISFYFFIIFWLMYSRLRSLTSSLRRRRRQKRRRRRN
jgi:hypothetical protein